MTNTDPAGEAKLSEQPQQPETPSVQSVLHALATWIHACRAAEAAHSEFVRTRINMRRAGFSEELVNLNSLALAAWNTAKEHAENCNLHLLEVFEAYEQKTKEGI